MNRTANRVLAASLSVALTGCGAVNSVDTALFGGPDKPATPHIAGFIGGAAADEPRAVLAAKDVLASGGNAADAAVALGFMLAVTLPSRASLGAGGACLAYDPRTTTANAGVPEAVLFPPVAPASAAGDRPAAVPTLARGLYLLHARYGSQHFEQLIAPAEQAAGAGMPISQALALDLAPVAGPLLANPAARAVFAGPGGRPLAEGDKLVQSDLAATLSALRTAGVGDGYQGFVAHQIVEGYTAAGGPVTIADLRAALPSLATPILLPDGDDRAAFLPPPADGGLAAAAAFQVLRHDPAALGAAEARALGAAATWRTQGGDPVAILAASPQAGLPALPASTSFVVLDRHGGAIACALSMGNLWGTGRVAAGTGIVIGASPAAKPAALLAAAVVWNEHIHAFRMAVSGSGQNLAGLAVAATMVGVTPPDPGRANVVGCTRYLPGESRTCTLMTDPRGAGLAQGAD